MAYSGILRGVERDPGRFVEGVYFEPEDEMPASPADLFEYLLRPRRKQEATYFRGGMHYGPSREEGIPQENLYMAAQLLKLMTDKSKADQEATKGAQEIESGEMGLRRMREADAIMGRLRGGGQGEMSISPDTTDVWRRGNETRFGQAGFGRRDGSTYDSAGNTFSSTMTAPAGTSPADVAALQAGGYQLPYGNTKPDADMVTAKAKEMAVLQDYLKTLKEEIQATELAGGDATQYKEAYKQALDKWTAMMSAPEEAPAAGGAGSPDGTYLGGGSGGAVVQPGADMPDPRAEGIETLKRYIPQLEKQIREMQAAGQDVSRQLETLAMIRAALGQG